MLTEERYERILKELEKNSIVNVSTLVDLLHTSESTIRRDLNYLHKMHKLNKVHGGATAIQHSVETTDANLKTRETLNIDEKIAIAKKAATFIKPHDFVYIDAGSTTYLMIDYIEEKDAIYLTNGINHANKLMNRGFHTYILGGEIKPVTQAIIGGEALRSLEKYHFSIGFFGTNGLCINEGFTTPELKEALVKQTALQKTRDAYVLADHSKYNKVSCVTFGKIDEASVILTKKQEAFIDLLKKETNVIEVEVE